MSSFEDFLLASGQTGMPDAQKGALLRHCLGVEGRRVLAALPLADGTCDSIKAALKAHFCVEKSRRMYRLEFGQRQQRVGEPAAHFVAALRDIARHCAYGALEDSLILLVFNVQHQRTPGQTPSGHRGESVHFEQSYIRSAFQPGAP